MEGPPPFRGEGEHALWHYSENPDLHRFDPHVAKTSSLSEAFVWAVQTRQAPHFWFPRDCPRGCAWITPSTTDEDRVRFLGHSVASRLHVIESAWASRMASTTLYAYRMPPDTFEFVADEAAGYWVSRETVEAVDCVVVDDLIGRHGEAGIELRITPDIWPFWHSVIYSTLNFSGSRLRNATNPEPPMPPRPWVWSG